MNRSAGTILVSGVNPFDKSFYHLQQIFDHQILLLITEMMFINVTILTTPLITNLRSYELNPDKWILEQIVNGSAEMSSSSLILSPQSEDVVSYSFGIGTFRPQLYYKARSLREEYNIYLIPFSSKLWICLIATAVLLIITLTFILSREAKLPHEISYDVLARIIDVQQDRDESVSVAQNIKSTPKELLLQKEKWELGEILLICLGAACQQGSARDPSINAARIVILCLFVLSLVGYTAYSASVISLVSLFPSTKLEQMRNLDYLLNQHNRLLYSINKIEHLGLNFPETEFTDLKNGFDKALEGRSVLAGDGDSTLTFFNQQKYNTSQRCTLGRTFLGVSYHRVLAFKKNSQYKEQINYNILRLKQFGLLNRERRRIYKIESPCTNKEKLSISNFISFNQDDVRPVINLFTFGVLISLSLLVFEILFFFVKKLF